MICVALHLYFSLPRAPEATHGYLHGGVLIDFIGQSAPTWKLHLVLLDAILLLLQLVMLSALVKRQKLKRAVAVAAGAPARARARSLPTSSTGTPLLETENDARADASDAGQDLDAEERGIRRRGSLSSEEAGDRSELLESALERDAAAARHAQRLDAFGSGDATVANLLVVDTVVEQYVASRNRPPDPGGGLRAQFSGGQFRLRLRINGRTIG